MPRQRRAFTAEFKLQLVKLYEKESPMRTFVENMK